MWHPLLQSLVSTACVHSDQNECLDLLVHILSHYLLDYLSFSQVSAVPWPMRRLKEPL